MVLISQKRIKGQSGLELLMLATFVLFAFSAAYITFMHNDINTVSEKINRLAKKTTDDVAFEIRVAFSEGGGYEKNFTIPSTFLGTNYIINVTKNLVYITLNDRSFLSYIPNKNITGYIIPGKNRLYNYGGEIYANP